MDGIILHIIKIKIILESILNLLHFFININYITLF